MDQDYQTGITINSSRSQAFNEILDWLIFGELQG
jgi:hypothetical protein